MGWVFLLIVLQHRLWIQPMRLSIRFQSFFSVVIGGGKSINKMHLVFYYSANVFTGFLKLWESIGFTGTHPFLLWCREVNVISLWWGFFIKNLIRVWTFDFSRMGNALRTHFIPLHIWIKCGHHILNLNPHISEEKPPQPITKQELQPTLQTYKQLKSLSILQNKNQFITRFKQVVVVLHL